VLAGEPVIKGSRIAARLVADLIKSGTSRDTIRREYDLSPEQIAAAVVFDRLVSRQGRPQVRKLRVRKHRRTAAHAARRTSSASTR